MTRPPFVLPAGAVDLTRRHVGEARSFEVIPGGQHTTLRVRTEDGGDVIVKVFPADSKGYATERAALSSLKDVARVPRLYASGEEGEVAYLLISYIPARSLAARFAEPGYSRHRAMTRCAEELARLHSALRSLDQDVTLAFPLDELSGLASAGVFALDEYLERTQACERFLGAIRLEKVHRTLALHRHVLDRVCSPRQLIHGDYQPRNLLFDDERGLIGVIDWELARRASPLCDLAMLLRFCESSTAESELLSAYGEPPWSEDSMRFAARCYDLVKVTLGVSKAKESTSDMPLWLEFIDGCLDYVDSGASERFRAAAGRLLLWS